MNELFRAVSERLKTLFTAHAALELEAELLIGHVARKATLLKRAAQLEEEGLPDLATELRQHAGAMNMGPSEQQVPALAAPVQSNGAVSEVTVASPSSNEAEIAPSTSRKKKS